MLGMMRTVAAAGVALATAGAANAGGPDFKLKISLGGPVICPPVSCEPVRYRTETVVDYVPRTEVWYDSCGRRHTRTTYEKVYRTVHVPIDDCRPICDFGCLRDCTHSVVVIRDGHDHGHGRHGGHRDDDHGWRDRDDWRDHDGWGARRAGRDRDDDRGRDGGRRDWGDDDGRGGDARREPARLASTERKAPAQPAFAQGKVSAGQAKAEPARGPERAVAAQGAPSRPPERAVVPSQQARVIGAAKTERVGAQKLFDRAMQGR